MININLRDVEKIIAKKEKEGITFKEAAESYAEAHGFGALRFPKLTDEQLTDEQLKKLKVMIEREPGYIHIEPDSSVRPLPCVRDEHGEIKEQTFKQLFAKINEEMDELKFAFKECDETESAEEVGRFLHGYEQKHIVEEAADVITAITTLEEALGIDATMRNEAQRRVNAKNRERGRL